MRATLLLLFTATALAGCMTEPPAPTRTAEGAADLERLTAGKAAGAAVTCLPPSVSSRDMTVIDPATVAFRNAGGGGITYINHLRGECSGLGRGSATLVVRSSGSGTCSGDIAVVTDVRSGLTYGSCALGEFVPYTRAGG